MAGRPKRIRASRLGSLAPREAAGLPHEGPRAPLRRYDPARVRSSSSSGLRHISLSERLRSARDASYGTDSPEVEPAATPATEQSDDEITDALYRHLRAGRGGKAGGLIQLLALAGRSVAQIVDGSLRPALARIGEDHAHGDGPDTWAQRATEISIRILHELPGATAPTIAPLAAVGAAPPNDPYVLGSMAAATVLESIGFDTTNLGPATATATLVDSIHDLHPAMVWLSVTAEIEPAALNEQVETLLEACDAVGATLMLGGRHAHRLAPLDHPRLLLGDSMVELAAFATGLARRTDPVR